MMNEKIQKRLAQAGLSSRRQIETWIQAGRVSVNGQIAKIGDRITEDDKVFVDNREIKLIKSHQQTARVLIYHKPEGEICSRHDPEKRPTIFERLPAIRNSRWICVGRLDFNTSGLLLVTNDGTLANQLMHPRSAIVREYAVRVRGEVAPKIIAQLKQGVKLEDGMAHFDQITEAGGSASNHWYHVIVKEGRNRLVRRLWEAVGITVSRLIRIRFGPILLPTELHRGQCKELTTDEVIAISQTFL
jgi:23S rRNA pseudouridine2605 synthase